MGRIAIVGGTGRVGSALVEEALRRGHQVTAMARNASAKLSSRPGLSVLDRDASNSLAMVTATAGHDAVFSAARFTSYTAESLVACMKLARVPRLLVVGGAGSLLVGSTPVVDTPEFPPAWKAGSMAGVAYLEVLRREDDLDWTFVSPSKDFVQGERTGVFSLAKDQLLHDASGRSWITFADYAIAFVDEFERPAHPRTRFTVGY